MTKVLSAIYAMLCYGAGLASLLYLIGFTGNFIVPRSLASGPATLATGPAVLLNVALLIVFAMQHSVMARPAFKERWARLVPRHLERSTYVLLTSLLLGAIFRFWAPLPAVIWSVEPGVARGLIRGVFVFGWLMVLTSSFLIDHFGLLGIRQVHLHLNGRDPRPSEFQVRFFHRLVRHPISSGLLISFWATPVMSAGHLLFAAGMTVYILIATRFEERDLVAAVGPAYLEYQRKVPALLPLTKPRA